MNRHFPYQITITIVIISIMILVNHLSYGQYNEELTNRLEGVVIDADNRIPLEYATITALTISDSSLVTGGITNNDGRFSIPLNEGNYYIQVKFISYQTVNLTAQIKNQSTTNIGTIKLYPDTETLKEVIVEGKKDIVQMQLDKRIFNVGENATNLGSNAADILNNLPSIQVDTEGNVSLRGSENVNILIDGKPSGLVGLGDSQALRQLQANMIESIEVVTNPSARYDAEGSAGIINIILKKENREGINGAFAISIGYPELYNASLSCNYRIRKLNLFANYGLRYNRRPGKGNSHDYYFPTDRDTIYYTIRDRDHNRGGISHNIKVGVDWYFDDQHVLTGTLLVQYGDEKNITDNIFLDYNGKNDLLIQEVNRNDTELEKEDNLEYSLNYKQYFKNKDQSLNALFQYRDNAEIEDSDIVELNSVVTDELLQQFYNDESEVNFMLMLDYVHPFNKESKFEIGYKGTDRTTINNYKVEEYNNYVWSDLNGLSNDFEYNELISASYAIYSKQMNLFSYQAGIRAEYTDIQTNLKTTNQIKSKSYLNIFPSVHVTYEINKGTDLQLSYSKRIHRPRFRHLNPFSSYSDARNLRTGNPDLNPEFTDSFEAGYLKTWEKGSVLSSVYYNHTNDVVERLRFIKVIGQDTTNFSTPYNLASRDAYGIEFTITNDITEWWTINSNANIFRAMVSGEAEGQYFESDTYSWKGRFNSKMTLFKFIDFQSNLNYTAPQMTTQGERKSMIIIDFGFSKDVFNKKGTLTFTVQDAFNSRKYRGTTSGDGFFSETECIAPNKPPLLP